MRSELAHIRNTLLVSILRHWTQLVRQWCFSNLIIVFTARGSCNGKKLRNVMLGALRPVCKWHRRQYFYLKTSNQIFFVRLSWLSVWLIINASQFMKSNRSVKCNYYRLHLIIQTDFKLKEVYSLTQVIGCTHKQ